MLDTIDDLETRSDCTDDVTHVQSVYSLLMEHLKKPAPDNQHRPQGIHASELTSCLLKASYSAAGVEQKKVTTPRWRQLLLAGSKAHDALQADLLAIAQNYMGDGALEFEAEVPVNPSTSEVAKKYNIYGHADGVFSFYDKSGRRTHRLLLEIKSKSPEGFERTHKPDSAHIEQAHVYMKCLDIPLAWICYIDRSSYNIVPCKEPFLFFFNESVWRRLVQKIRIVQDYLDGIEEPEPSPGMHCEFCPYAHCCEHKWVRRAPKTGGIE